MHLPTNERFYMKKNSAVAVLSALLMLGSVSPANAHATINMYGNSATAGGYGVMFIRIPHGCDGKATEQISVIVPKEFQSVKAQWLSGWKTSKKLNSDGSMNLFWRGGPLPDDQFADFGINVKFPSNVGTYYLKVSQKCGVDFVRWNQIPKSGEELEYPAPSVKVGEAVASHH